jgi:ribosome maturation protein SDO1
MKIKITTPKADGERIREAILGTADTVVSERTISESWETVLLIDPAQVKVINELLNKECPKGRGITEVLSFAEFADMGPLRM